MRIFLVILIILSGCTGLAPESPVKATLPVISKINNHLIKVAVIDTGMDFNSTWEGNPVGLVNPIMCPGLSKDFTDTSIKDHHGHGTHISGLIAKGAQETNYCLIMYKYWVNDNDGFKNLQNSNKSFRHAIDDKVDIINFSGGGIFRSEDECVLVKEALDKGIKVVAAAGNEGISLDKLYFYPASCDDRVYVIEAIDKFGKRISMSNYSNTTYPELGKDVLSLLPNGQFGFMSGTSQATAIFTGKLVKRVALERLKE